MDVKKKLPEKDLIEGEMTLRTLRIPDDIKETSRPLIRWFALSLGLISPGETRQGVLAVIDSLLHFNLKKGRMAEIPELMDYITKESVFKMDLSEKSVRYHLGQLKKSGLIESRKGKYGIIRSPYSNELVEGIKYWLATNLGELEKRLDRFVELY